MIAVEEVTDRLVAIAMSEPELHPTVFDVFRIHRIEEARHMRFGYGMLEEEYRQANALERLVVRITAPVLVLLIFEILLSPEVYERCGLVNGRRESTRIWRKARQTRMRRELRQNCSARILESLSARGIAKNGSLRIWRWAGLSGLR